MVSIFVHPQYANILGNLENRLKLEILARFGRDTTNPADINLSDYASDMESRYKQILLQQYYKMKLHCKVSIWIARGMWTWCWFIHTHELTLHFLSILKYNTSKRKSLKRRRVRHRNKERVRKKGQYCYCSIQHTHTHTHTHTHMRAHIHIYTHRHTHTCTHHAQSDAY